MLVFIYVCDEQKKFSTCSQIMLGTHSLLLLLLLLLKIPSNFPESTMKSWMCHKLPWELFVRLKLSCHFMSSIERISFVTRQKHSIVCTVRVPEHGSNFIYIFIFYYIFECYLFTASYRVTNILFKIPRLLSWSAFILSPFFRRMGRGCVLLFFALFVWYSEWMLTK